jgi:hypothetical protein
LGVERRRGEKRSRRSNLGSKVVVIGSKKKK